MRKTWRAIVALLGFVLLPGAVQAQVCPGVTGPVEAYAREAITVSTTALPFTAGTYADGRGDVKFAQVTLESNNIRVSVEGLVPSATVGELWETSTNVKFVVCGQTSVRRFRAIRQGAADATLTVTYFR